MDKEAKPAKTKQRGEGKAQAVAMTKNMKIRIIAIAAVALVCILALIIGLTLGIKSCSISDFNPVSELERYDAVAYKTNTKVLYSAEVTSTVPRNKPVEETKNESAAFDSAETGTIFANGAKRYPKYGSTLSSVIGTDDDKVAARNAIISESGYLCAWGTAGANNGGEQTPDKYTKIDKNGYLYQYKNNEWIHSLVWGKTADQYTEANYRQLYKHSAAEGMYMEGYTRNNVTYAVADDAPRVVKQVNMKQRSYGYGITGLYAPAGEVIKVELSGKDMNATGGITVHIGQALYNGQANNIWSSKNQMQRFPYLLTTLQLNKNTCEYNEETDTWTGYIGSFIGGPIYIRSNEPDFTAKISGGVEYLHFILGYTTEAEFNRLKTTSRVPMFDLEVWDRGVLLSGPRYYAEPFSYEDLYKAAALWDKVASVTTTNGRNTGIVFLFDPFVAAGAAVAFPGRDSVNCPSGWMTDALNYNGLVTSGSWGNFHEYHHNFQNYGVSSGANGEVTNNGLNLVSYSLFTKISANRGIGSYGAQGLGGWNNYTSAPWVIQRVNAGEITSTNGLAIYATLLHNFGQDAFIKARGTTDTNGYLNKWANLTHQDMTYFASKITDYGTGTYTPSDAVKNANYPLFVPVASVYQTGRSYMYDDEKRDIKTMQPYVIPYGEDFTVDLRPYTAPNGQYASGSIVIGNGFEYKIKNVTQPSNGSFTATATDGVYVYTPDTNNKNLSSGQIRVTLEITATKDNTQYANRTVNDVDLILEFQQSHETNKMKIQRTTYSYSAETMYKDAVTAYESGFAGYTGEPVKQNQFNPTQNANTDIWFYPNDEANHTAHPNDPDKYFFHDNQIEVLDGKLYFDADGTYRVYLRGRDNCALYYSLDQKAYAIGAKITKTTPTNGATANFRTNAPETYFDIRFDQGRVYVKKGADENFPVEPVFTIAPNENKEIKNWLYIREVLIVEPSARSFIGVGTNQWVQTMFTVRETYHKADNSAVDSEGADGYAYTKTTYYNQNSAEVAYTRKNKGSNELQYFKKVGNSYYDSTAEEVAKLTESKLIEPTSANYVNAYRSTYEFPDNKGFESDYFYTRSYSYNYTNNVSVPDGEVSLIDSNYAAPPAGWGWGNFPIANLTDGKANTYIHTNWQVSANKPLSLTFDLGGERKINRITFICRNNNGMLETPKAFTVEGSLDGIEWFDVAEFTDAPRNGNTVNADFEEATMRFCRIKISAAHQNNGSYYIVLGQITFTHSNEILGGKQISPDDAMLNYSNGWHGAQATSTFGHILVGNKNAKVSFEFEGTRLGILTSPTFGRDFEVTIDGKVVSSIELTHDMSGTSSTYISEVLASGKHSVTIKCTGEGNIDSFVIYP